MHWYCLISSYYSAFGICMFSPCTGMSLYLPIIWLFRMGAHWLHCKVYISLSALAVSNRGVHQFYPGKSENLSSPPIWCFTSQRPSAFGIYMFSLCTGIALYLLIILPLVSACFLYALVCPYIFLLFDCFEWALIDCIVKCRVHSALWQFQMGQGPSVLPR